MKIAGKSFSREELALCLGLMAFFSGILIGAFAYSYEAALFPFMLSVPGLVLMLLYLFRGALSERIERVIMTNDTFAIGMAPEVKTPELKSDDQAPAHQDQPSFLKAFRPYFVFIYTGGFALLAWAVGFYAASIVAVLTYVAVVRKELEHVAVVGGVILVFALGTTVVFDSAFGHHYGQGEFLSFF